MIADVSNLQTVVVVSVREEDDYAGTVASESQNLRSAFIMNKKRPFVDAGRIISIGLYSGTFDSDFASSGLSALMLDRFRSR